MSRSVKLPDREAVLLSWMEAARRRTGYHLDLVYRQIEFRAERVTTAQKAKVATRSRRRPKSRWTRSDEALFRSNLERLEFERSREIEVLTCTLSRQEAAISALQKRHDDTSHHERNEA